MNKQYKIERKRRTACCTLCPLHRGENQKKRRDKRNWKRYRKTQWK